MAIRSFIPPSGTSADDSGQGGNSGGGTYGTPPGLDPKYLTPEWRAEAARLTALKNRKPSTPGETPLDFSSFFPSQRFGLAGGGQTPLTMGGQGFGSPTDLLLQQLEGQRMNFIRALAAQLYGR